MQVMRRAGGRWTKSTGRRCSLKILKVHQCVMTESIHKIWSRRVCARCDDKKMGSNSGKRRRSNGSKRGLREKEIENRTRKIVVSCARRQGIVRGKQWPPTRQCLNKEVCENALEIWKESCLRTERPVGDFVSDGALSYIVIRSTSTDRV